MKTTTIAAFLRAGLLFSGALSGQDTPAPGKKAEAPKESSKDSPKVQPKPASGGPTNPAKPEEPKVTMDPKEIRTAQPGRLSAHTDAVAATCAVPAAHTIAAAWGITVPASAVIAGGTFLIIQAVRGM